MNLHLTKKQKVVTLVFSLLVVVVAVFVGTRELDNDEGFALSFKSSFTTSQPEQIITEEVYKKPLMGQTITVPVIVYHSIRPGYSGETDMVKRYTTNPDIFEKELIYLKEKNYNVISFDEMLKYFDTGKPLREKSVILTFDDGWESQYKYAFPLLKKYGFTGTFFIFTNAIGHKHFMTWDQIKEMDAAGMIIGGHTKTHPYLTKIIDPNKLADEINGGKKIIEEHLGKTIQTFAYPFGLYNDAVVQAVRDAGYRIGRTSSVGINHTEKDLLVLKCLYDRNSLATFNVFEKSFDGQLR